MGLPTDSEAGLSTISRLNAYNAIQAWYTEQLAYFLGKLDSYTSSRRNRSGAAGRFFRHHASVRSVSR
jgi:hypothetical protein